MTTQSLAELVDDFIATEHEFHPVDASFAGARGFDALLPPNDAGAADRERAALRDLAARFERAAPPVTAGERLDRKLAGAQIAHRLRMLDERPLAHNPAWATGEAAFAIISLLLRDEPDRDALAARVAAIPDFFHDATERLRGVPASETWRMRAVRECGAIRRLLEDVGGVDASVRARAQRAADDYAASLADSPGADPACGEAFFAFLMREVHGLEETPAQLDARAEAAFARCRAELEELAARLDPATGWREQLAQLELVGPQAGDDVLAAYRDLNTRALADAATLVTPAAEYGLTYADLPAWAAAISSDLYFLFYRSPRALDPGTGSVYWVGGANDPAALRTHNFATMKLVHVLHHGSIGHHTQNARARAAQSKLARIAATDGAAALAFLSSGTLAEGWACYVEDLMAEIPGFYTPAETLALKAMELRNIGCVLGDLRLHTGRWTIDDMRAFYGDEAGFAPARIANETTRNAMFPGTRIMYWLGVEAMKSMRAASTLGTRDFHDALLAYGAAPTAWIAEEMARCD